MDLNHSKNVMFKFKHGRMASVLAKESQIEVEVTGGKIERVRYDVLVFATGGVYLAPWRANDDRQISFVERTKECGT